MKIPQTLYEVIANTEFRDGAVWRSTSLGFVWVPDEIWDGVEDLISKEVEIAKQFGGHRLIGAIGSLPVDRCNRYAEHSEAMKLLVKP